MSPLRCLSIPVLLATLLCSSHVYGMEDPQQNTTVTKKSWSPLTQDYVDKHISLAEQGDVQAQDELMDHYLNGRHWGTYLESEKINLDNWPNIQKRYLESDALENFILQHFKFDIIQEKFSNLFNSIKKRAESKIPGAQYNLGHMCEKGLGIDKNPEEAFSLVALAAEQKYGPALDKLGHMYEDGIGVERDAQKAREIYQDAAKEGGFLALRYYFLLCANRSYTTPDEKWSIIQVLRDAADLGNAFTQGILSEGYRGGYHGLDRNDGLFNHYVKLASAQGDPVALTRYAQLKHYDGKVNEAIPLYKLAAIRGHDEAQAILAMMYNKGRDIEKNLIESFRWHLISGWRNGPLLNEFLVNKRSKPTAEVQDFQTLVADIIGVGAQVGEESGLALLINHHHLKMGLNTNSGFSAQTFSIKYLKELYQPIASVEEEMMGMMQFLQTAKPGLLTGIELSETCKQYLPFQSEPLFFSLDKIGDREYLTVGENNVPFVPKVVKFYAELDEKFDQAVASLKRLAKLYQNGQDKALTELMNMQCLGKDSKEKADMEAFEEQKKKHENLNSSFAASLRETNDDLALLKSIREKITALPSHGADSRTKAFLKKNSKMAQYY